MTQAALTSTLARYLPTRCILRRFIYMVLGMWLSWFALFAWLSCVKGCASFFWGWMMVASLVFGIVFSCYVWALTASIAIIVKTLGFSSRPNWLGSWPQPVGIAILGWLVSAIGLLVLTLLFKFIDTGSPFGQWYLGFVALFLG